MSLHELLDPETPLARTRGLLRSNLDEPGTLSPSMPAPDPPSTGWRHPSSNPAARVLNSLLNSPRYRALGRRLPSLAMASDITDVVYISYLLDVDTLAPLVQSPLELQRLGPDGRFALFTFLTYRHGHFGPRCFGPIRRVWPSPIQSNWRIHVANPATGVRGIQFLTTAITSLPHAIATRLLADGVPMHIPRRARLDRSASSEIDLLLDPGAGSAPAAEARLRPALEPSLSPPWDQCFESWRDFLAYCVPQDRAMCVADGRVIRQEIDLGIPLDACRPLAGQVSSSTARAIAADAAPLCFLVDRVAFSFHRQEADP